MKHFYITIILLLAGYCGCHAQNSFDFSISFNDYFERLSDDTHLNLYAKAAYGTLPEDEKILILRKIFAAQNKDKFIVVHYKNQREVWYKNASGKPIILDAVNLDMDAQKIIEDKKERFVKHPWFVYGGGQSSFTTDDITNIYVNSRIGFFLMANRWDLALSLTINTTIETNISFGAGLVSKFYLPVERYNFSKELQKMRIHPYVGGGITRNYVINTADRENYTGSWATDFSVLTGVNWYFGPGSFDIGLQYGNVSKFTVMIGYVFSL
jgi:hypothetical protein